MKHLHLPSGLVLAHLTHYPNVDQHGVPTFDEVGYTNFQRCDLYIWVAPSSDIAQQQVVEVSCAPVTDDLEPEEW